MTGRRRRTRRRASSVSGESRRLKGRGVCPHRRERPVRVDPGTHLGFSTSRRVDSTAKRSTAGALASLTQVANRQLAWYASSRRCRCWQPRFGATAAPAAPAQRPFRRHSRSGRPGHSRVGPKRTLPAGFAEAVYRLQCASTRLSGLTGSSLGSTSPGRRDEWSWRWTVSPTITVRTSLPVITSGVRHWQPRDGSS